MGERNIFGRICCPRERRVNVLKFGESCELENFWKFKNFINLIELKFKFAFTMVEFVRC